MLLLLFYCLLSQPSLIPKFLTCSHASSLALFPIESLQKITFEERTATRTGHFHFETIHRRKNTLLLVTALHWKSNACPSFLMTFLDHLMLFDYFSNVFFFLPFLQVLFWSLYECYVRRELLGKEQLFVHLRLKILQQDYHVKNSENLHILDWICFLRFFSLLFLFLCSFVFFASDSLPKKINIYFWLFLWFILYRHLEGNRWIRMQCG